MTGPFLVNLRRIDSLDTFFFRKLVAPNETRYCAGTVYLSLFVNFNNAKRNINCIKELMCKRDHLITFDSESVKISNVVLYIVFLCISK